ncbi:MAG: Yip1 family protein [Pseudomonadales bacterium]
MSDPVFDVRNTMRWVVGALRDPDGTALAYRGEHAPWQRTFLGIAVPLLLASAVVGVLLGWLSGRATLFGLMPGPQGWMVLALAWSVGYVLVAALLFDVLAGVFGGDRDFDAAVATVTLALVPAALASALNPLPWIGWLIGLAGGIYSLVLAWRFVPVLMNVPEERRAPHFVASVASVVVANLLVAGLFGWLLAPSLQPIAADEPVTAGTGVFGNLERQAQFAELASRDTYDPPRNGRLIERQVREYVRVLERTAALRERLTEPYRGEEEGGELSLRDLVGGVGVAVRVGTAEMEVVKSGGGNWAEHQWVRNQLETARVQRDGNRTIEHNYALFRKYQDEIERFE